MKKREDAASSPPFSAASSGRLGSPGDDVPRDVVVILVVLACHDSRGAIRSAITGRACYHVPRDVLVFLVPLACHDPRGVIGSAVARRTCYDVTGDVFLALFLLLVCHGHLLSRCWFLFVFRGKWRHLRPLVLRLSVV
ncbi:MAG TPA: hypothetical protein VNY76_10245 [Candidatus Acidoferrales bacterium]|nr:hypothetical protein [Candidatus Acidoferrales bacterium]